ncbi:unnamed protein product [Coffea canephora]|uniref:Uncharacterized protein n=1 Tax=Coffea canephora TaxID=49390 RepID=A0A068UBI8_COFCA|nr:unnamed protein product [Coffea canephora]
MYLYRFPTVQYDNHIPSQFVFFFLKKKILSCLECSCGQCEFSPRISIYGSSLPRSCKVTFDPKKKKTKWSASYLKGQRVGRGKESVVNEGSESAKLKLIGFSYSYVTKAIQLGNLMAIEVQLTFLEKKNKKEKVTIALNSKLSFKFNVEKKIC